MNISGVYSSSTPENMSDVTHNCFKQLFYGIQDNLKKLFKEELVFG